MAESSTEAHPQRESEQFAGEVRGMFDRIAGVYDLMNSAMSAGLHHQWRGRAVDRAEVGPGSDALDVCCGTGDLALELRRRIGPDGRVVGSDFSEPMLEIARRKSGDEGLAVEFGWADALDLPYGDASFDAVTVGFGARNLADLDKGIAEMTRVLRPRGRLVILEIARPTREPLASFYGLWFDRLVPILGSLAGDPDAYSYLPESVRSFPQPRELAAKMDSAGLTGIRWLLLAGGIIAIHSGKKRWTRSAVPPPVTAVMDAASGWLPAQLAEVERRLAEVVGGHGPELGAEAEATLAAGGKRLRPMLVLICAGAGASERAVRAAVSVELVHMATLVHDDVLDGAPVRRGQPTVFARSGRAAAVGVGDLLFSRAFAELAPEGAEEVAELSSASVALAQGELAQRRDAYDTSITERRYLDRCSLKTARLFESACRVGRLASGRPGAEELAAFGREIGLAFQLLDDVLDVTGPPERTGKARGTDLLDGTVTLPLIRAMERDPALASIELGGLDQGEAERICDRIAATGVLDEVRARAREGIERAKGLLESPSFTDEERLLLALIADGVVERYS